MKRCARSPIAALAAGELKTRHPRHENKDQNHIGRRDKGWIVMDMKVDWKIIYPTETK